MRKAIEEVLSPSFDIVAAVPDGRQAVEAAYRLAPDVVVLDISMPVLDGFGAARELTARGTQAKILFLSVHDADKYVAAAFEAGGQGYVAKPRLATDLEDAITHVLQGRLRLPTPSSLLGFADPRARHAAHLDTNDGFRLHALHEFAGGALKRGDTVVTIARLALLDGLRSRLGDEGWDLASLGAQGRYRTLDAETYLSRTVRGHEVDETAIVDFLRSLEDDHAASATSGEPGNLVVLGEGAPMLLEDGNVRGAVALERIWHRHSNGFQTLCFYRNADLPTVDSPEDVDQLYALHPTICA
jgi:CheY-like chemotaxis protein